MKRVLVAPLDWGLGHATRCIPIIKTLIELKCSIFIGGSGRSLALLRKEFPSLFYLDLPAYDPRYAITGTMVWKMTTQLPKFFRTVSAEHRITEHFIGKHAIDLVISDNRYGCWSAQIPSIFITHQSNVLMPRRFGWLSPLVRWVNENQMQKFTCCWIPDLPGTDNITGNLISFGRFSKKIRADFIGPISRFTVQKKKPVKYDVLAICSGPEPQRTLMEQLLTNQLSASGLRFVLIKGLTDLPESRTTTGSGEFFNYLTTDELQDIFEVSDLVIARSGYSTIMDLYALGKPAVFIPTPGQTEQEYLALRLKEKGISYFMHQSDFDLRVAMQENTRYSGFIARPAGNLYADAIRKIISDL